MKTILKLSCWLLAAGAICFSMTAWSDGPNQVPESATKNTTANEASSSDREKLSKLQTYVGQWRGVGQPKRGSTTDAWTEECSWAWNFESPEPVLKLSSPNGKYLREAILVPQEKQNEYQLVVRTESGDEHTYRGELAEDGTLVLSAADSPADGATRITIRQVAAGDRMLVLYERKQSPERFSRMAEVGFTRQGSGFGKGTTGIECVVTGGTGTIPVMHQGKTYYVCCTGCRDYFNDNPDEVLAEYRARKEEEKAKK